MLRALLEREITARPGRSARASARSTARWSRATRHSAAIERMTELWQDAAEGREVYGDRRLRTVRRAMSTGTHIYSSGPLQAAPARRSSATSRSRSCRSGSRCARPASSGRPSTGSTAGRGGRRRRRERRRTRAAAAGQGRRRALPRRRHRQLHPGRPGGRSSARPGSSCSRSGGIDRPLKPPRRPWEVARVSFEIARRHRFAREMSELPDDVEAHVLPARGTSGKDDSLLRAPRLLRDPAADRRDVRGLGRLPGRPVRATA